MEKCGSAPISEYKCSRMAQMAFMGQKNIFLAEMASFQVKKTFS
jgi:hypothetical protein